MSKNNMLEYRAKETKSTLNDCTLYIELYYALYNKILPKGKTLQSQLFIIDIIQ